MRILVVPHYIPMPDRAAVYLRFFAILRILARSHLVHFHAWQLGHQTNQYGEELVNCYKKKLLDLGVRFSSGDWDGLMPLLRQNKFDAVLFEHYEPAQAFLDEVRYWQPEARVVVDTVDIEFLRLLSKAKLSRDESDFEVATETRARELKVYRDADLVIAISDEEKKLLLQENPATHVAVVPLINDVLPSLTARKDDARALLFVGNFEFDANVDAIRHFCHEIFPIVRAAVPQARLRIVGNAPTATVSALAGDQVEVLGFVPDIRPLYEVSDVAVAPVRYGGGLKGKISEALSYGLPVVTTSVGAEGFGLEAGHNVMLGDDAQEFADAVIALLQGGKLYDKIRTNGWRFAKQHYSEEAVAVKIEEIFARLPQCPVRRLPVTNLLKREINLWLDRHLMWRFKDSTHAGSRPDRA